MKTKIIIGIVIIVVVLCIAGVLLYSNQNHVVKSLSSASVAPAASISAKASPNPFQAFYDFFPQGGQFQICVKQTLGNDFTPTYDGVLISTSASNILTTCAPNISQAYNEFPQAFQQCLKNALGSDLAKELASTSVSPFQPTSDEQQKLQNCSAVKQFTSLAQAAQEYIQKGVAVVSSPVIIPSNTVPAYFEIRELDANKDYIPTGLDSRYLVSATVTNNSMTGMPFVTISLNAQGNQLLETITTRNKMKPIGIFVNGKLLEAPIIQGKISGPIEISLSQSLTDAQNLADSLNAGKGLTQMPK